jgi:hypothetical protein
MEKKAIWTPDSEQYTKLVEEKRKRAAEESAKLTPEEWEARGKATVAKVKEALAEHFRRGGTGTGPTPERDSSGDPL